MDLSIYDNSWYKPGKNFLLRTLWFIINNLIIRNHYNPSSRIRVCTLRLFGAKIGKQVTIKPGVNIKYPWKLSIGDYSWIGEDVWIDNLDMVTIDSNVCISQGAMLLCGNHNYKNDTFDLIVGPIRIEDSSWICAKSVVCQNSTLKKNSVLGINSVASGILESGWIYRGNPAVKTRIRH